MLMVWPFLRLLPGLQTWRGPIVECGVEGDNGSWGCPTAVTEGPGAPLLTVPLLKPGAPLSAIRVCLQLAVAGQWLCMRFWQGSRSIVADRGLFPTTHVAAIKSMKGPWSREPLFLRGLSEIPQSRCYSNWTHFLCLRVGRRGGRTISAVARLQSLPPKSRDFDCIQSVQVVE